MQILDELSAGAIHDARVECDLQDMRMDSVKSEEIEQPAEKCMQTPSGSSWYVEQLAGSGIRLTCRQKCHRASAPSGPDPFTTAPSGTVPLTNTYEEESGSTQSATVQKSATVEDRKLRS